MLIHHIVTIMLICMSYDLGVHRIGVVLLLLHNISDVFLDSAKCFHYVGLVGRRHLALMGGCQPIPIAFSGAKSSCLPQSILLPHAFFQIQLL